LHRNDLDVHLVAIVDVLPGIGAKFEALLEAPNTLLKTGVAESNPL